MHSARRSRSPRISRRQRQILAYCLDSLETRGFAPSIREIGAAVDLSSSSTVHSHLRSLETKGFISRNPSKPRSITILRDPDSQPLTSEADRLRAELMDAQAEVRQLLAENERLRGLLGDNVDNRPQEVGRG